MHREVYEFLLEKGVVCDYDNINDEIKINITIDSISYELCMKFPLYYPYEFPHIYIKDKKELVIPHLYTNNRLCLYDVNEVLPNPSKYLEEALESVNRAEKLLADSKNEKNLLDYQAETVTFWETKASGKVDFLGGKDLSTHLLWNCRWLDGYNCNIVAESKEKIVEFVNDLYDITPKKTAYERALFVNVGKKLLCLLNNIGDIKDLIPKSDISQFYSFLAQGSGKGIVIIYADNGAGECLLSLEIELLSHGIKISKRNIKGILEVNKNRKFKYLKTENFQMKRLFTRGGDGIVCFDKKCLLIGCGSIGSYISKAIVDIGITDNITLLDNDFLEIENLARHLCGSQHLCLQTPKVDALKRELLRHYPTMECNTMDENAWEYILNNYEMLNLFDLLLVCVGNTVIEKEIIHLLKERKIEKECIILWIEPYAVAGHALILQRTIDRRTEKNLFDSNGMFNNNVLVNGREYLKSEAGCQSAYAPYAGFETQKFVLDFIDIYYRKIYKKEEKCNYEFIWIGKMKWARQQKLDIKPRWRSKEDRYMELRRIDGQ